MRPLKKNLRCKFLTRVLEGQHLSKDGWIVAEIGVWRGDLAYNMLRTEPRIKKYYAVDPYKVYDSFRYGCGRKWKQERWDSFYEEILTRFEWFNQRACFIREESVAAAPLIEEPLDLVYIDAKHDYYAVKEDIGIWYRKVRKNGILAGHDYGYLRYPGVQKAVDEFVKEKGKKLVLGDFQRSVDWYIIK